jgi:hypothetical protein
MNAGPSLRFASDGHLYSSGELDGPSFQATGIFEWSAPGVLQQFYPTPVPFSPEIDGFDVLLNGNFLIADLADVTEVARDFSVVRTYTATQGGGWQGIYLHNGSAFVVGAQEVGGFDTSTGLENLYYQTMTDNSDLAVRADGVAALNYQFHDNPANFLSGNTDWIELRQADGTFITRLFMPDPGWAVAGGLAFTPGGGLLAPVAQFDSSDAFIGPVLARYDSSFNYLGTVTLDNWRFIQGIAVAPIPEPASLVLAGAGLLGFILYRRKRG